MLRFQRLLKPINVCLGDTHLRCCEGWSDSCWAALGFNSCTTWRCCASSATSFKQNRISGIGWSHYKARWLKAWVRKTGLGLHHQAGFIPPLSASDAPDAGFEMSVVLNCPFKKKKKILFMFYIGVQKGGKKAITLNHKCFFSTSACSMQLYFQIFPSAECMKQACDGSVLCPCTPTCVSLLEMATRPKTQSTNSTIS